MKNSTFVTVYIAIPMPTIVLVQGEDEDSRAALYDMLEELCLISKKIPFIFEEHEPTNPTIELVQDESFTDTLPWSHSNTPQQCEILSFSSEIPFNLNITITDAKNQKVEADKNYIVETNRAIIRTHFAQRVLDLIIAANLSRVGSMELFDSCLVQDGRVSEYSTLSRINAWPLQRAVKLAQRINWPKLYQIEFLKVWSWVNKNDGFVNSFGGGPVGRALNAFSRLLELHSQASDEAVQLLWSLVGIEALYSKGKVSIMEQIRDKTQTLLGKQTAFKKKFSEMYEFRSKFIHGDLDFPGLSFGSDAAESYSTYLDSQADAVDMAIAILVATLQELIVRNWSGLEFVYKVDDIHSQG